MTRPESGMSRYVKIVPKSRHNAVTVYPFCIYIEYICINQLNHYNLAYYFV